MSSIFLIYDIIQYSPGIKKNISIKQQKGFLQYSCTPNYHPFVPVRIFTWRKFIRQFFMKFNQAPTSKLCMTQHFDAISINKIRTVVEMHRQIPNNFSLFVVTATTHIQFLVLPFFPQDFRIIFYKTPPFLRKKFFFIIVTKWSLKLRPSIN